MERKRKREINVKKKKQGRRKKEILGWKKKNFK